MAPFNTMLAYLLLVVAPLVAAMPFHGRHSQGPHTHIHNAVNMTHLMSVVTNPHAKDIIPNSYIVVYNSTFGEEAISAKQAQFATAIAKRNLGKRSLDGNPLSTKIHSFKMHTWRAMALDADDDMIKNIFDSDEVAYIEADTKVQSTALVAQTNATPGLIRLSNRNIGGKNYIFDNSAAAGMTAYVVDTGIRVTHVEFGGRATFGANFVNSNVSNEAICKEKIMIKSNKKA